MDHIIQSPGKYIQGADVITRLGDYLKPLSERWLIVGDKFVLGFAEETLRQSLTDAGLALEIAPFGGECSQNEIDRLRAVAEKARCGAILGIGGGKTLDTAKALAHFMRLPVAIAPTIASTDAPCSALSVIYTDSGEFERYLMLPKNPEMVIVDTRIVAGAPARLLAAGIGDALATWFEARACSRSDGKTMAGGQSTQAALALAELCYNTLVEEGEKAMLAAELTYKIPVIIVSARPEPDPSKDVIYTITRPAAYLKKPFESATLISEVKRILEDRGSGEREPEKSERGGSGVWGV